MAHRELEDRTGTYRIVSESGNIIERCRFNGVYSIKPIYESQLKTSQVAGKKYFIDVLMDEENYEYHLKRK